MIAIRFLQRILPLLFFACLSGSLWGANVLSIGSYDLEPSTEWEVQVESLNDSPFVAFQADIPIPDGFQYIQGSAILNAERSSGHTLSASLLDGNVLRLIAYSVNNLPFTGNAGALLSFRLKSGTAPGIYPLNLLNPMLGNEESENILTEYVNGSVRVLAPDISLSTSQVDFGRVPLGTAPQQYLTIYNQGSSLLLISNIVFEDAQFTSSVNAPFSIEAGRSFSLPITFSPVQKGNLTTRLFINSNDPDEASVAVKLKAIPFAVNEIHAGSISGASLSSGILDLSMNNMEPITGFQLDLLLPEALTYQEGSAQLFRSVDHVVSVNSISGNRLRVLAYSPANKAFQGNEGKLLSLGFDLEGVAGYYYLSLDKVILADDVSQNVVSDVYGGYLIITSSDIDADYQFNFGEVSILSSKTANLTVRNYGQENLVIDQLLFSNSCFSSNQVLPLSIAPYETAQLPLRFASSTKGNVTGTLKLMSNDPDENPFTVQLSGTAFVPNYIRIDSQAITQGQQTDLAVAVDNEESFVALQFDLNIPEGLMPDLQAIYFSERSQDHIAMASLIAENRLRIVVYSPGAKPFLGKSGPVLYLPLICPSDKELGSYNLSLGNAVMSNVDSENILYDVVHGTLRVNEPVYDQSIALKNGWNLISFNVVPTQKDLLDLFRPLIDSAALIKVMDEKGLAIEHWGVFGGWQNEIGQWQVSEGYKILLSKDATFTISGTRVPIPQSITLNSGWNIISWPMTLERNVVTTTQVLIDNNHLIKVMDETGMTLEDRSVFGGWKNDIGSFKPGKAYKILVTETTVLNIQ